MFSTTYFFDSNQLYLKEQELRFICTIEFIPAQSDACFSEIVMLLSINMH